MEADAGPPTIDDHRVAFAVARTAFQQAQEAFHHLHDADPAVSRDVALVRFRGRVARFRLASARLRAIASARRAGPS